MEKKEVIKVIGELTKKNSEYRAEVNDQLNKIRGFVEQDYNQGAEDAWKLARKVCVHKIEGGYTSRELMDIFETGSLAEVFDNFTAVEAMARVKEYEERKKKEEKEKQHLRCGDVVKVLPDIAAPFPKIDYAVYLGANDTHYSVLVKNRYQSESLFKKYCVLVKTGEHVDLSWLNGDEEE